MLFRHPPTVEVGISEDDRCAVEATSDAMKSSREAAGLFRRGLGEAEPGGEAWLLRELLLIGLLVTEEARLSPIVFVLDIGLIEPVWVGLVL